MTASFSHPSIYGSRLAPGNAEPLLPGPCWEWRPHWLTQPATSSCLPQQLSLVTSRSLGTQPVNDKCSLEVSV
jgi:hypothetical protein